MSKSHHAAALEKLLADRERLTDAEKAVLEAIRSETIISISTEPDGDLPEDATLGERVADRIADVGGSWTFIMSFVALLAIWIALNSSAWVLKPFDSFPFILLNLLLSCLAALQAPVIMMSQNRKEAQDRRRANADYKTNLKAELEIRHLHLKLDQLIRDLTAK